MDKRLARLVVLEIRSPREPDTRCRMTAEGVPIRLGLVVGKFAPLHRGHEVLIREAGQQCKRLLILSYTNPECPHCEVGNRRRWLAERFPEFQSIVFDQPWLDHRCAELEIPSRAIPDNGSSDDEQQRFLAWTLGDVLRERPDTFFCNESYGPSCAKVLSAYLRSSVTAVALDSHRTRIAVSATQIRRNPKDCWEYMDPTVRTDFVRRIAVLGGESSGKTTLTAALADHFQTNYVDEYGRELWEAQAGVLTQTDLSRIAKEQIRREAMAARSANALLFCDTSPLTTVGYSEWMFDDVDPELTLLSERSYDAYILCQPDFPFVQDGTRRDDAFRLRQHAWYRNHLHAQNWPTLEVVGRVTDRIEQVCTLLSRLA